MGDMGRNLGLFLKVISCNLFESLGKHCYIVNGESDFHPYVNRFDQNR
jgi:hypothetical protein